MGLAADRSATAAAGGEPVDGLSGLHALLRTEDLTEFFAGLWEQRPVLVRGAAAPTGALLSREQFEFYLRAPRAAHSDCSIVEDGLARPVVSRDGATWDVSQLHEAYAAGRTLLQTGLEFRNEAVARLCEVVGDDVVACGRQLAAPVGANAYLTPPFGHGFGVHYDDHCSLVIQLAGRKAWTVYPPDEVLPVERCAVPLDEQRLSRPVLEVVLEAGDVLYVPRGFPHVTAATDEHSLHLTLGVRAVTWADVVAALARRDARLRPSAVTGGTPPDEVVDMLGVLDAPRPGQVPADGIGAITASPPRSSRGLRDYAVLYRGSPPTTPRIDWVQCAQRLSDADCDEIVAACSEFPETVPTTVGEDTYPNHRRAVTRKVDLTARTEWIFDLLCEAAHAATTSCFGLELTGITRAPQYCEYRAGYGQFDRHNDYSHDQADSPRKLTVIVQLSDPADYAGGRFQVFGIEPEDLPAERGTILLLPSFVYHQVTPVEQGLRRALVAWVAGPRLR